ncbi:MAG: hypothetical protein IPM54_07945 [Polyangiaceae bacterium]|nr:hypothetical protein [Polyangiaceae bacterium]
MSGALTMRADPPHECVFRTERLAKRALVREHEKVNMRPISNLLALLLASCLAPGIVGCGGTEPTKTPAAPPPIADDQGKATNLTCPGMPGCENATGDFMVGAASKTISPAIETWTDTNANGDWDDGEPYDDVNKNGKWDGVWLAGFGMGRAATGVHDDAWARAVTLEQGDVSIGMISLDVVGFFQQWIIDIREAAAAAGLDFDHVLVSSTHVHEMQDTVGQWGPNASTTGVNPAYMDYVISQAVEALKEAKAAQKKSKMVVAQAQRPELVNDTRPPIVVDQNINTIQFQDDSSAPIANVVIWGNHPEALGSKNQLLTSDYPHYLREAFEAKWPSAPAIFFSGPLGGLTTTIGITGCPDAGGMETCPQGTFERAEYVGKGAGDAAIAALEGPNVTKDDAPALAFRRRAFLIPPTNVTLALGVLSGLIVRDVYWADGRKVADEERPGISVSLISSGEVVVATEVNGIQIGPVAIAGVPGEMYTELWLEKPGGGSYIEKPEGRDFPNDEPETPIQAMLPAGSIKMIINCANDFLGYIVPRTQWDFVEPWTYGEQQYGEENSAGDQTAPIIESEFAKMYGK